MKYLVYTHLKKKIQFSTSLFEVFGLIKKIKCLLGGCVILIYTHLKTLKCKLFDLESDIRIG